MQNCTVISTLINRTLILMCQNIAFNIMMQFKGGTSGTFIFLAIINNGLSNVSDY